MTDKQTILVAGATGNIGKGAALSLAQRGANVVLLGRKQETLEAQADRIRAALAASGTALTQGDVDTLPMDFSDMESVRAAAAEAVERFPRIDGLVLSVVALVQNGPNILPSGHELMFATNVMGPFLFTRLLLDRLQESDGMILHVIAPFEEKIDWDDLESIKHHDTETAYHRTKTCHRAFAAELARRYEGTISSVAFNPSSSVAFIPSFIIDKSDPELKKRWPSGFMGFFWNVMTVLFAKPPAVAGEPIADLMLSSPDRDALNGVRFNLDKRIEKPDKTMVDEELGQRLWDELLVMTEPTAV